MVPAQDCLRYRLLFSHMINLGGICSRQAGKCLLFSIDYSGYIRAVCLYLDELTIAKRPKKGLSLQTCRCLNAFIGVRKPDAGGGFVVGVIYT